MNKLLSRSTLKEEFASGYLTFEFIARPKMNAVYYSNRLTFTHFKSMSLKNVQSFSDKAQTQEVSQLDPDFVLVALAVYWRYKSLYCVGRALYELN